MPRVFSDQRAALLGSAVHFMSSSTMSIHTYGHIALSRDDGEHQQVDNKMMHTGIMALTKKRTITFSAIPHWPCSPRALSRAE